MDEESKQPHPDQKSSVAPKQQNSRIAEPTNKERRHHGIQKAHYEVISYSQHIEPNRVNEAN